MIELLKKAWGIVEEFYKNEQVNSERCLQAVLYHALLSQLPSSFTILVEPNFNGKNPDLVIRDATRIRCVAEIKYSPHWYVPPEGLKHDIEKLTSFSKDIGSRVGLDTFGPSRRFNPKQNLEWIRDEFAITDETWFVFAVLTRYDDRAGHLDKLKDYAPSLNTIPKFCLLTGRMNPDLDEPPERCQFTTETLIAGQRG